MGLFDPQRSIFTSAEEIERRIAPRMAPDGDVCCRIRDPRSKSWLQAAVRDLSVTGVALLASVPFAVDSLLTIELRHDKRGFARKLLVAVRHADICYPNDAWLHGCSFLTPLSGEELRLLL